MTPTLFVYFYIVACRTVLVSGATDERYLLTSTKLPDDVRLVPAVGNGHVATQVYSDTVYMNSLMNGYRNDSHRARIPSTVAFNISLDGGETSTLTLDMYKGIFIQDFDHSSCTVQQRIYAHRTKTRILVNEFTVTRKGVVGSNISINLAINQGPESPDIDFRSTPHGAGASHWYGTVKEPETNNSGIPMVHVFFQNVPASVILAGVEGSGKWTYITAISPVQQDAMFAFQDAISMDSSALLQSHQQAWANLWRDGRIEVNGNMSIAQLMNACFFHIMISTPDAMDSVNPFAGLSPGGLARGGLINTNYTSGAYNDYAGHVFWDMDTWILPPVLMVHPDKAEHYLDARLRVIDVVRARSVSGGYDGVRFPWEQGWTGYETCPWNNASEYQIHVTADVSYAIRQYMYSTKNMELINKHGGKDMVMEIARFWRSRSVDGVRERANVREIYGVMGPDEYHYNINNSVFTNYNAKLSMEMPGYLKDLGVSFSSEENGEIDYLSSVGQKMFILFDDDLQYHPQFEGFDKINDEIKQSDVVLLGYPLMMSMDPMVRENDLVIYENLTDQYGPDTGTWSMHTVGWLELGKPEKAEDMFFKMFRNINGPFLIFSEKPADGEDGMRAVNFITGMGGLLQSVFFGYGSIRVRMHQLDLLTPYVLPYSTSWSINGLDYRGSSLDLFVYTDTFTITLISQTNTAEDLYCINQIDGKRSKMNVGEQLEMNRSKVSFVVESELEDADIPPDPVNAASRLYDITHLYLACTCICTMYYFIMG